MIAISALMVDWATFKATYPPSMAGQLLTIKGTNGSAGLFGVTLPIWMYTASSIMGLVTSILIILKIFSVSRLLPIALMSIGIFGSVITFVLVFLDVGQLRAGPFLLSISSGIGIVCLIHSRSLNNYK
jgi:hypothetical protein